MISSVALVVGALDVADQPQRRAQHVADAERDRARVQRREVAVEQILDDRLPARREHRFGNLAAGLERAARQRDLAARARQLELEPPSRFASMMKPRSAPVTSMAESSTSASTSSSTRPDPSARSPSSSAAICRSSLAADTALFSTDGASSSTKKTISVSLDLAEPDVVAVREHAARSMRSSLTNVPKRDCRSRSMQIALLDR